jgi:hypothetical protein
MKIFLRKLRFKIKNHQVHLSSEIHDAAQNKTLGHFLMAKFKIAQ